MAQLLPAVGIPREVTPHNGRSFTLRELQTFVGGYLEALYLRDGRVMYLDADGKRHQWPINHAATSLMRSYLRADDVIVGDVIICTRREADEEEEEP